MKFQIIAIFTAVLIIAIYLNSKEDFATKREKASTIFDWFQSHLNPAYVDYKRDIPDSNVVEYQDVLDISKSANFTVSSVENKL